MHMEEDICGQHGLVAGVFDCGPSTLTFLPVTLAVAEALNPNKPNPVVHDCVNKGLGMSSRVCVTG